MCHARFKIVGEELVYQGSPPTLGQHSNDILKNLLGMSPEKITDLEEKKIINSICSGYSTFYL